MGYRDDPEARSTLNAAFMGLGIAVAFLAVLGAVTFFWAGGGGGGEAGHAEGGATPAAAQH